MKKTFSSIVIILLFTLISCNNQKGYLLTGDVTGFPDSTMVYLINLSTDDIIDSTIIIDNKFVFKGQLLNVPEEIWLETEVDNKDIYTTLLIGNENVHLEGDIKDFPWNVKISGSKTQDEENYLQNLTKPFDIERDTLVQNFFKLPQEIKQEKGKEIWDRISVIDSTTDSLRIEYVKSHINTYSALINLGYLTHLIPKDTVQALYNKLLPELKTSRYAKIIEVFLNEKISEIGDIYHDFEAFNKNGDKILFSNIKGKYILLDFTAANCGSCVQSADELREIDKTYSDSLTIVSFSGDIKKDVWLKSLERDSTTWISLWDGEGTYSATFIKYGVQGFPTFFLINPKGKIIDIWSGYGKGSLKEKLNRFKNN